MNSSTPTAAVKHVLTTQEASRMAELEPIIQKGLANFVEVGNALLEISDRRLYRQTHSTFKDYVEDKWKMNVRQAYRLCESAEVVKGLPAECDQLVTTESQARELARAPASERPRVLQAAAEHGPVTAKAIKVVVDKQIKPVSFRCDACDGEFDNADEAESLYECEDCGTRFTPSTSDTGNHQCSCGKFASKVSALGCPECGEGELVVIETELDVSNSASFAEAHEYTMARLAAIGARLKLPDLTIPECVALVHEAGRLTNMWGEAHLRCERELGKILNQAEAGGYKDELLAEVKRLRREEVEVA